MTTTRRMLDAPAVSDRQRLSPDLIDVVERAGLRGRGGAGFPVARKMRTALQSGRSPVLVVNAAEGEPASCKDRALLTSAPHLVLEGAHAAAEAVGAREIVVATHDPALLRTALAQDPGRTPTRLVVLQPGYVRSEASAVVSAVTGGPGLPTTRRRPQAQQGPGRRPWLVQNAETLACVGLLVRHGLGWYREVGLPDEAGTLLLTVHRDGTPQVLELAVGTPLGTALGPAPLQAVLTGGYAGRWLAAPDCLAVPVSTAGLRSAGGSLGAGLVVTLPRDACGLATTARLVRYLADQSAGQCGPCLNGLPALAAALDELVAGGATQDRIRRWCGRLPGRGACSHPDGVAALVSSALDVFGSDLHRSGPCGRPALELPT